VNWIFVTLGIAVVIILIGFLVILRIMRMPVEKFQTAGITRRKFTSRSVAIGLIIGIPLGLINGFLIFENAVIGIPFGVAVGILIGLGFGKEEKITTEEGIRRWKRMFILTMTLVIVGVLALVSLFLIQLTPI
jgi:hypothetical protein